MMISIIIPVYKDLDSLVNLLMRIEDSLNSYSHEIIIVNDFPDDDKLISELAGKYEEMYHTNMKIINRPGKMGVASAIMDGINAASYNNVCTLNADLQHPPELLPSMIEELRTSDIVIASRYVEQGKIEKWSLSRKIISKWAIVLARMVPRIKEVKDPMSGYYALKKDVIKNKEINPPRHSKVATGFKLPVEILAKGDYKSVKEIPYKFSDRKSGKTNMGAYSIFIYLKQILGLINSSRELNRIGKFLIVGFIGTIVNVSILYLFTEKVFGGSTVLIAGTVPSYLLSSMVAMESAIISNFIFNEHWTFKDRRNKNDMISVIKRGIKFNMCRLTGVVINVIILFSLTEFFRVYYILSSIIAILIVTMWNYTTSSKLVWSEKSACTKSDEI
jgi:dolichol-phosphate mannosyltransferase